jgi:hypothetical protein
MLYDKKQHIILTSFNGTQTQLMMDAAKAVHEEVCLSDSLFM